MSNIHFIFLVGGEEEEDLSSYEIGRMFNFSVHENFADELTEDRGKKLNEIIAADNADKKTSKVEVKSVKRMKKDKDMKLIKGVLHSQNEKSAEEAFAKLSEWLDSNYEVKLHAEKFKTPKIVQTQRPTPTTERKTSILLVSSIIIVVISIALYYYLH